NINMALEGENINNNYGLPVIERLNSVFKVLLRNWLLLLIIGFLGGLGGIIYALYHKPEYKSHLTFALDDDSNGSSVGNLLGLASQFGFNIGSSKDIFSGDNILEIMKSRRMIENVFLSIDTFHNKPYTLIEYYLELNEKFKGVPAERQIHFPVGQARIALSYRQDSLLYKVYQSFSDNNILAQRPDRKLSIYEINVTSPDERFTKDFTDRLLSATNEFYVELRTKKAKQTLDVLEQRVAAMKGNLNSSITNKAAIQDINVNPAFSEAQVPVQKQQANIQVYGEAYAEMFKNLELARFQYLNEIPLMQIIDAANYPMQKITLGKLKMAILFAILAELLGLFIVGLANLFGKKNKNSL
ncbi:MAG: Wzz/FepE/Etk N-terminal domain-containing protein, partial [Bacteroidota bacterium]|nr:Wzz/FepE/Etk N-terminal domain-containing protein [Bacteroidota bacterium]